VRRWSAPLQYLVCTLLVVVGAAAGWVFHRSAARTVLEQIHLQDDFADRVVREALEERIEDAEALLDTLARLASQVRSPEGLAERMADFVPLVQPWISQVCVRPSGANRAACLVRRPEGDLTAEVAPPPEAGPIPAGFRLGPSGRPTLEFSLAELEAEVRASAPVADLLKAVLHQAQLPGDAHVEVYAPDGTLLVHPNPSYVGHTWEQIEARERSDRDRPAEDEAREREARRRFVSGKTGRLRYRDHNLGGRDLFAHYGPFPAGVPGFLVYSHGLGPVPLRLRVQGWISAGFGALFVLGVFGVWRLWREAEARLRAEQERSRAVEARAQAEAEVQALLDQMGIWIFSTGPDGRIVRANRAFRAAAATWGVPDPVGRSCREATPTAICRRCVRDQLPAGRIHRFETTWNGRTLLVTQAPVCVPGRETELLHLVEDVTEVETLRGALARSERQAAAAVLAGSVAHEIRNAVTAVHGYADLLETRPGDPALALRAAGVLRAQMDRIRLLASNLTELARPRPPERRPVDLERTFRGLLERLVSAGPLKRFEIEPDWASLPAVTCDPGQVEQVLTNLLLNAVEAMGDAGILRVGTRTDGEWVRLWVEDSGPGIPTEDLDRVFEPFYTTKGDRGTGLGLYVCQQVARAHGGRIEVRSELGRGSRFELVLPRSSGPSAG